VEEPDLAALLSLLHTAGLSGDKRLKQRFSRVYAPDDPAEWAFSRRVTAKVAPAALAESATDSKLPAFAAPERVDSPRVQVHRRQLE